MVGVWRVVGFGCAMIISGIFVGEVLLLVLFRCCLLVGSVGCFQTLMAVACTCDLGFGVCVWVVFGWYILPF